MLKDIAFIKTMVFLAIYAVGVLTSLFVVRKVIVLKLLPYLKREHNANKQSREILDLIKMNNPTIKEPIFNHDIQPDFSGYLN